MTTAALELGFGVAVAIEGVGIGAAVTPGVGFTTSGVLVGVGVEVGRAACELFGEAEFDEFGFGEFVLVAEGVGDGEGVKVGVGVGDGVGIKVCDGDGDGVGTETVPEFEI